MGKRKQLNLNNIVFYSLGTVITAALGMISAPFLTRIVNREVYAQYGMIISLTGMLSTFIYLGQDESFMRYYRERKENYWCFLFRCMRYPTILFGIVCVLLTEPSHIIIGYVLGDSIRENDIYLLCIYLFALIVQRFLMLTARMEERAVNYLVSNIITKGLFLVVIYIVYLLIQRVSISWIIIALTSGTFTAMLINIHAVYRAGHFGNQTGNDITSNEMLKYGLPLAISTSLSYAIPLIEKLLILDVTNWDVLATYTSASIFITVMSMVKTTASNIWVPYAYKSSVDESSFKDTYFNIGIVLSFFVICILCGTILTRRWLVRILDNSYYDVYIIAPAIVCGTCFDILSAIYSVGINIKKKTSTHILIPLIRILISLPMLYCLLPAIGLRATGLAYLISIAISRIVEIQIALHYYNTGKRNDKLYLLMGAGMIASILSLFMVDLKSDVAISALLFVLCVMLVRKELASGISWLKK